MLNETFPVIFKHCEGTVSLQKVGDAPVTMFCILEPILGVKNCNFYIPCFPIAVQFAVCITRKRRQSVKIFIFVLICQYCRDNVIYLITKPATEYCENTSWDFDFFAKIFSRRRVSNPGPLASQASVMTTRLSVSAVRSNALKRVYNFISILTTKKQKKA